MTSIPEITRMVARIEDWKGRGRYWAAPKPCAGFEEIADMLTHMRRELLGGRTGQR